MMFIDTHTHLYLDKFDADRPEMIQRAVDAGVEQFFLPNIDSGSIASMLQLEKDYPERCFPMMGLHPCSVKDNYKAELATVERWLEDRSFCAVGEIGIDLYWDKTYYKEQVEAFRRQSEWAKSLGIPIVIHSREATDILIDLVAELQDGRLGGIFHCFGGSVEQARRIQDLGFYLGIGGVLTFKKSGLDKTIAEMGMERVVLETDAPYLAPVPYRGKRNESAYVVEVAKKLAAILEVELEEVARITTGNARRVFKMPVEAE